MYKLDATYNVGDLADEIFENEFDGDLTLSNSTRISGWLSANIGKLNNRIYTEFVDVSGYFAAPEELGYSFGYEEASIFTQMYMTNYYQKSSRKTLMGQTIEIPTGVSGGTSTGGSSQVYLGMSEWTKIQEGDTTIERQPLYTTSSGATVTSASSTVDIDALAKEYRGLMNDAKSHMEQLIIAYNLHGAKPRQT